MKPFITFTPLALLAIALSNCTTVENKEAPAPKPAVQSTTTSETTHASSPYYAPTPATSTRTETTTVR